MKKFILALALDVLLPLIGGLVAALAFSAVWLLSQ